LTGIVKLFTIEKEGTSFVSDCLLKKKEGTNLLQLSDLCWHAPGGESILKNINLTIPDGKLVVITGPNGGGKTTLAKLISGVETPDSGKIILDGEDITGLDVTERALKGISYAFQQPIRFKGLTVRDLLELASGETLSEDRLCALLSKVGLCAREYIDREVDASLSGGEIKRIEIATVLARHTKLTIFDEPEAGIDLWSFAALIDVFQEMRGKINGSMVIISHQERILQIADELVVIADGQISCSGKPDQILPTLLEEPHCEKCPKEEGEACE
jgi:Fe-S cluster assembly ATP-binding protein